MRALRELLWCGAAIAAAALLLSGFHGCSPAAWWTAWDEPDPYTIVRGPVVVVLLPLALAGLRLGWVLPPRTAPRWRRPIAAACLLLGGVGTALLVMMSRVVTAWDQDPDGGFVEYLRLRWLLVFAVALVAAGGFVAAARTVWPRRRPVP